MPNFTATATSNSNYGAIAGFVNVPPGVVTVTATPLALGKPASIERVLVRAGAYTQVFLHPTP